MWAILAQSPAKESAPLDGLSIDEGGDWDGSDDPKEETSSGTNIYHHDEGGSLLETLERKEELQLLEHPLLKIAPFAVGGGVLLAGARIGYMRQMHEYEMEEGEAKRPKGSHTGRQRASKWGNARQRRNLLQHSSQAPGLSSNYGKRVQVDPNWSPHRVAVRALAIGTMAAVGTFAVGTAATFWYLDVKSIQGFSDKMGEIIPHKFRAIQGVVRPPLEKVKGFFNDLLNGGMTSGGRDSSDSRDSGSTSQSESH